MPRMNQALADEPLIPFALIGGLLLVTRTRSMSPIRGGDADSGSLARSGKRKSVA